MPIYELTNEELSSVSPATFASQKITEEAIQKVFRTQISKVYPDLYVLAEEFSDWEDSSRSIDLLCLDKEANLVVVELKRTEDGGHMELQAIRYAAMVSTMTFEKAVEAHARFLKKLGKSNNAQEAILNFLEWETPELSKFAQDVRIILISAEFKKEITTAALWLNDREIDIRCVRLRPYAIAGRTVLDIQQVIPLPVSTEYQVQLRKKEAEKRQAQSSDWTKYELKVGQGIEAPLYKRALFLKVVQELIKRGRTPIQLLQVLPQSKFLVADGKLNSDAFRIQVGKMTTPNGTTYNLGRYFYGEDELIVSDGKTYALSNQWSRYDLPFLDELIAGQSDIAYRPISEVEAD